MQAKEGLEIVLDRVSLRWLAFSFRIGFLLDICHVDITIFGGVVIVDIH